MLKTFTVAPKQDSIRTAFSKGPRLSGAPLSLERLDTSHPEYVLKQGGVRVAILRGKDLDDLLYSLSAGWTIPAALDDAVDAQDDEFFTGIPEVAYTGQPEPEQTPPAGTTSGRAYPWTFWYRGRGGDTHQVILEATYEDAQRVWDKLSTTLDMTSKRP